MTKYTSANLQALFALGQAEYCGLYQFNLVNGGSLYYSSGDVDIYLNIANADGDPFWANQYFTSGGSIGPYFDRKDNKAKMHQAIGLQVDTLVFDVIPASSTINGASFLSCVRNGVFDGAELIYLGAFWPLNTAGGFGKPIVPTGTIKKYVGRVAEVDASRNLATFTINSYLELLNQNMPRNLFQATCVNTLYDGSCGLNQSNFTNTGTALSGSLPWSISTNLAAPSPYSYNLGVITFTSGLNEGVSRTVKQFTAGSPGSITLIAPFPSAAAGGDAFSISAGCTKLQQYCAVSMANLANFRGFPYVPQQEAAS